MSEVKYVMVDELLDEVVDTINSPVDNEIYAGEAKILMENHPLYIEGRHYLYLKVGGQEGK